MGAGGHLVGISNWDPEQPATAGLPRVGDYRTVDWEKLVELRPDVLIIQYRADKMPPGMVERAQSMGIRVVNVKIVYLDDVFATLDQLGEAIGERERASAAAEKLRAQLAAVRQRVAGRAPVRTLIARDDNPLATVGGGNYLDEVLRIAGGKNVVEGGDNSYPDIDKEMLARLNPDAVLQLLPQAPPQVVEKARDAWRTMPTVNAVRDGRIYLMTERYLLLPGLSLGNVAELFAEKLHSEAGAVHVTADRHRPSNSP